MNNDKHNSTIDNETANPADPVASAKAAYLAALSEHELLKPACRTTGICIGQVWDWRARDIWFDLELRRIWLKEEPPTTEPEVEYPAENAGANDCDDTATSQCS